jgi:hypothetical protein
MSRLTLNLPDSLYQQLSEQAEKEGVPLQHYLVYSLTRLVSAAGLEAQRTAFEQLVTQYPQAEAEEALQLLLASRSPAA